jgi:hypothetical protein
MARPKKLDLPKVKIMFATMNKLDMATNGMSQKWEIETALSYFYDLGYRLIRSQIASDAGDSFVMMFTLHNPDASKSVVPEEQTSPDVND